MLEGKRIVLGVTGGIAAYKAVEVCRRLVAAGAHVTPVLTEAAQNMVGLASFAALAPGPVKTSLFEDSNPIPHTELGQNSDLILVCPATARLISDYRSGRSGDLLSAVLIATRAPVVLAPAMHTEMWEHPAVQDNMQVLASRDVVIVGPAEGVLAGGDVGVGRLADPEVVVQAVTNVLSAGTTPQRPLAGRKVLVTAGGTREIIDPVRFIANRSSGRQGHALAAEALGLGADVVLVTTSHLDSPSGVERVDVESAQQMHDAVISRADVADVIVMAAAVADFRPIDIHEQKIKKAAGVPQISLEPTVDILKTLGAAKRAGQVLVGFAAETDDVETNAVAKLSSKNADLIVANDVAEPGVGFGHETNAVTIYGSDGSVVPVGFSSKNTVAKQVLAEAIKLL